jgi:stage II sporulation protein AA (anti-sigma F factor antagonist)
MNIQHEVIDGVTVIAPVGRIDTTTSGPLEESIRKIVDADARELLVDFAAVDYISSAGLRVFLVLAKRMKDLKGRLVLCGMSEPVRQVFQLAGFMPLFTVEPSRKAVLGNRATGETVVEQQ